MTLILERETTPQLQIFSRWVPLKRVTMALHPNHPHRSLVLNQRLQATCSCQVLLKATAILVLLRRKGRAALPRERTQWMKSCPNLWGWSVVPLSRTTGGSWITIMPWSCLPSEIHRQTKFWWGQFLYCETMLNLFYYIYYIIWIFVML